MPSSSGLPTGAITVTLPLPSAKLHAHAKGHWRSKTDATAKARKDAWLMGTHAKKGAATFERAAIVMRFYWPDNRRRDTLNAAHSCKPYIDGLVDAGLIQDDCWQVLSIERLESFIDRDNPRVEIVLERKG